MKIIRKTQKLCIENFYFHTTVKYLIDYNFAVQHTDVHLIFYFPNKVLKTVKNENADLTIQMNPEIFNLKNFHAFRYFGRCDLNMIRINVF